MKVHKSINIGIKSHNQKHNRFWSSLDFSSEPFNKKQEFLKKINNYSGCR